MTDTHDLVGSRRRKGCRTDGVLQPSFGSDRKSAAWENGHDYGWLRLASLRPLHRGHMGARKACLDL